MAKRKKQAGRKGVRITNKKARHGYHILEVVEAGIELTGTEVKSLRAGAVKIDDAYARLSQGQLYLVGANIAQYPNATGRLQHDPTRDRKLLLHRRQIQKVSSHVNQKGKTLVPLGVYFKRGWAKVELGVAVGKRTYDKRQLIKQRDQQRDIAREISRRQRRRR
ncbi:MAG: SsrA-binding protein SmpB [Phycisphaerae bacterium]|nr:SsrA-binding protein SmpB [Phycisphaerae bacterium]